MVQPFDLFGIALDIGGNMDAGIHISIFPTLTIRPSSFEFDLFFGPGYNTATGDLAFIGGVRGGYKVGPGVLYFEIRPFAWLNTADNWSDTPGFYINLGLGYQIGFISRKK